MKVEEENEIKEFEWELFDNILLVTAHRGYFQIGGQLFINHLAAKNDKLLWGSLLHEQDLQINKGVRTH